VVEFVLEGFEEVGGGTGSCGRLFRRCSKKGGGERISGLQVLDVWFGYFCFKFRGLFEERFGVREWGRGVWCNKRCKVRVRLHVGGLWDTRCKLLVFLFVWLKLI